tara:strand:+ start:571 stop:774 length:204 start_codon:yes stop_codon:yes gene_type:complete
MEDQEQLWNAENMIHQLRAYKNILNGFIELQGNIQQNNQALYERLKQCQQDIIERDRIIAELNEQRN